MGLFDAVQSALGNQQPGSQNDLMSSVMNLIGGQSGGLKGLIGQFTSKGMGDVVGSWVGTGANLPISAEQLRNVLGSDTITTIAAKLGVDPNAVTTQLAALLPQVVDKLTPDGKVPEGDIMSKGMSMLGGILGSK